jgi:hypothetical protein
LNYMLPASNFCCFVAVVSRIVYPIAMAAIAHQ